MTRARGTRAARSTTRKSTGVGMGVSTQRAAVLAIVVCALALTLAFPLRTYLGQRQQLADTAAQRVLLSSEVAQLEQQRVELEDPAYVQAEARQRLRYVMPGQTPFQVQLPGGGQQSDATQREAAAHGTWYSGLWASVNQPGGHR
ncbi:MAG: FtsB family cell division protein [Mycobacteriaceae bacterium]